MRIGLFFSDGLIGNITLNKIIPQMIEMGIEPVLFRSRGTNVVRAKIPELSALSYLETGLLKEVVEPVLEAMNKNKGLFLTTQQLVKENNLEFNDIEDVNSADFIDYIKRDNSIDGAISVRFYPKFKKEIITAFKSKGFLWNLHTGLLPKYKGVFIPYRAIENNEKYFGWTLHEVANEIDTGDIIAIDKLPLDKNKPVLNTYLNMTDKGSAMVMGALLFYKKRKIVIAKPQTTDQNSYFTYPTGAEMQKWNNQGIKFSENIVDTYCNLFATRGSLEEQYLREALDAATRNLDKGIIYKAA